MLIYWYSYKNCKVDLDVSRVDTFIVREVSAIKVTTQILIVSSRAVGCDGCRKSEQGCDFVKIARSHYAVNLDLCRILTSGKPVHSIVENCESAKDVFPHDKSHDNADKGEWPIQHISSPVASAVA